MIKIINDFFEKKDLKEIQDFALNKAVYTPSWFLDDDGNIQKNKEHHYGDRFPLIKNQKLFDFFIKQAELKFKIKLKKVNEGSGIDLRNLDHFKPHIDWQAKINILIMISGPTAVTNGTVFYTEGKLEDLTTEELEARMKQIIDDYSPILEDVPFEEMKDKVKSKQESSKERPDNPLQKE